MTTIQDRLTDAAARTHRELDDLDVDGALAATMREQGRLPRARPRPQLVAAALLAAIAIAAAVAVGVARDDGGQVVADSSPSTTAPTFSTIPGALIAVEQLGLFVDADLDGSIWYAGLERAFSDQWMSVAGDSPVPPVNFATHLVVGFTMATSQGCAVEVTDVQVVGSSVHPRLAPRDASDDACGGTVSETATFVVGIARADLPEVFVFDVPPADEGSATDGSLEIDQSTASRAVSPTTAPPPPEGPDLQDAAAGRVITFEGVADVRLGDDLDPATVQSHEGTSCGWWGPQEPSHDGDEPLGGLASAANTSNPRVADIRVSRNETYRTASGVGIGTTLSSLQRIYGDDLVVDRADGWENPTDGLLASYQDVAAVRNGDAALTFILQADVVQQVKVGSAESWGDDEGCA